MHSQQSDAQRAEQLGICRDDNGTIGTVGKRMSHGAVEGDASLQEHFLSHDPRSLDPSEVIAGNRINQSGNNVVARAALLLGDPQLRGACP